jgi:lipopolysaccharide transport system ATP-binding protein
MEQRFDDIAAFADIGEFIDQPVKLYSSGMLVRLAFAVQAQLDPDILIVDEALAVGDFAFQHKCMSKIKSLQQKGVAILFVSHDAGAVKAHCSSAIMLEQGQIYAAGEPDEVCVTYFHRVIDRERRTGRAISSPPDAGIAPLLPSANKQRAVEVMMPIHATTRQGLGHVRYQGIRLLDAFGDPAAVFKYGDWLVIELLMQAEQHLEICYPGFLIKDLHGSYLTGMTTWTLGEIMPPLRKGELFKIRFSVQLLYRAGNYSLIINNAVDNVGADFYDWCDNVAQFTILEDDYRQPAYGYGLFAPPMRVELEPGTSNET